MKMLPYLQKFTFFDKEKAGRELSSEQKTLLHLLLHAHYVVETLVDF